MGRRRPRRRGSSRHIGHTASIPHREHFDDFTVVEAPRLLDNRVDVDFLERPGEGFEENLPDLSLRYWLEGCDLDEADERADDALTSFFAVDGADRPSFLSRTFGS